jgi:hypothetical protein
MVLDDSKVLLDLILEGFSVKFIFHQKFPEKLKRQYFSRIATALSSYTFTARKLTVSRDQATS